VVRLHPQLQDADPFVAAIAAWRIGQVDRAKLRDDSVEALFRVYFGPGGLARDAAIASLVRLLGDEPEPGGVSTPPTPRQRNWDTVVERWLVDHLAPTTQALDPAALEQHREQLLAAWRASNAGTRAEINAARRAVGTCDAPASEATPNAEPTVMCLQPLVRGTVPLP
jgi:hypothetical protein